LRTFSKTGGIEQVSRVAGKALYEVSKENGDRLKIFSMYDWSSEVDTRYFPSKIFRGFAIRKLPFVVQSVRCGIQSDVVVLSHINLLLAGFLIKLLSPKTKLILIAHGIEAWEKFSSRRMKMLMHCDQILSVSAFTKNTMIQNGLPEHKFKVLNNCLDPFLKEPHTDEKSEMLLKRYGFKKEDIVLMTLTRLASKERYKGYDIVIESLNKLRDHFPTLRYLIVGKYDKEEKSRLDKMITSYGLKERVVFAGFIPDEEIPAHFNIADIYIMPSEKEGFGIVFIEAMYYNKPVIAGNKDGSVDALLNGKLGVLVNPTSEKEVSAAIQKILCNKRQFLPDNKLLMEHFSYGVYKEKWKEVLG
jgi:glycosyltransferase involved in cell wall biosynthesis